MNISAIYSVAFNERNENAGKENYLPWDEGDRVFFPKCWKGDRNWTWLFSLATECSETVVRYCDNLFLPDDHPPRVLASHRGGRIMGGSVLWKPTAVASTVNLRSGIKGFLVRCNDQFQFWQYRVVNNYIKCLASVSSKCKQHQREKLRRDGRGLGSISHNALRARSGNSNNMAEGKGGRTRNGFRTNAHATEDRAQEDRGDYKMRTAKSRRFHENLVSSMWIFPSFSQNCRVATLHEYINYYHICFRNYAEYRWRNKLMLTRASNNLMAK